MSSTTSTTSRSSSKSSTSAPLVTLRAKRLGSHCPFGNSIIEFSVPPGGCVCLSGASGLGKTTLATVLTGLSRASTLRRLDLEVDCEWDPSISKLERCGVLLQQTTLLDELTIAGNLQVALTRHQDSFPTERDARLKMKQLLEAVGLDYARDAHKRPTELSGGMGRRASLALQLAQRKHLIVLDEPFAGLDLDAAQSVAKELVHIRNSTGTALLLISHEPHLTQIVMDPKQTQNNQTVKLVPPVTATEESNGKTPVRPSLFGTTFRDRFLERLVDYALWSLPLIALAFAACGLAISMVSADLLQRLDISNQVLDLVDTEVRPLIKMLTGEDANALQMMGIRFKVKGMLNKTVPPAKAALFARGMTQLFVMEIGPLLTALLLCGRIGGSYAGKVATLHATSQTKLLQTLGVSPAWWTWWPSFFAATIAAPLLTVVGTSLALLLGAWVGPTQYALGTTDQFYASLRESIWPVLRLRSVQPLWDATDKASEDVATSASIGTAYTWIVALLTNCDLSVTYRPRYYANMWWVETMIEIATYPPVYHCLKSLLFCWIILGVAQGVPQYVHRQGAGLTPRSVPGVITGSVVLSGLLVILADWGFSQLWLLRV